MKGIDCRLPHMNQSNIDDTTKFIAEPGPCGSPGVLHMAHMSILGYEAYLDETKFS